MVINFLRLTAEHVSWFIFQELTREASSINVSKTYHDGRKLRCSCSGLNYVMDGISVHVHVLGLTLRSIRIRSQSIGCGGASSSVPLQGHRLRRNTASLPR